LELGVLSFGGWMTCLHNSWLGLKMVGQNPKFTRIEFAFYPLEFALSGKRNRNTNAGYQIRKRYEFSLGPIPTDFAYPV
jgi:hypothetical protein